MRKKKIIIAGAAALLAASMIGGTWAVWTRTLIAKNEYKTAKYSTFLTEHFKEPENWEPGITQQKEVMVTNNSTIPVVAQVKMKQRWYRTEDLVIETYAQPEEGGELVKESITIPAGTLKDTFTDGDGLEQYAAQWRFNGAAGEEVYVLESGRDVSKPGLWLTYSDGRPLTAVKEISEANGHWLLESETPDAAGWFTFYYVGEVPAGGQSPKLLEGVTMNPLLEATVTGSETYYIKDDEAEDGYRTVTTTSVTSKYGEDPGGYDGCNYDLNITMKTTQATEGGMRYTYKEWDEITEYIAGYITGQGYDGSALPHGLKVMTLVENGYVDELSYVPRYEYDGEDHYDPGNWFMSFTNMVPGENYTDMMKIENSTVNPYTVYMRIVPKTDEELGGDARTVQLKRELLDRIYMDVYFLDDDSARRAEAQAVQAGAAGTQQLRGTLIYRGRASGINSVAGAENDTLLYLIPLGHFSPKENGIIYVRLTLDPELGLAQEDEQVRRREDGSVIEPEYEYADLLTKVDWEFLIQGRPYRPDIPTDPDIPLEDIPDEEVPLTPEDIPDNDTPLALIPDEDVPLTFLVPVTGDERPLVPVLATVLAALGLMCVFGVLAFGDRKKEQKD